jgi:hypothetical protein
MTLPIIVAAIITILGVGSLDPAFASMHRSQAPCAHRTETSRTAGRSAMA